MFRRCVLCVVVAAAWLSAVRADDLEKLPPPREAPAEVPHPAYYRVSRYAVWQYYGVDRFNQFRPRVMISPYGGAYYLYDGSPYYLVPNQSYNVTTTIMGTPYR